MKGFKFWLLAIIIIVGGVAWYRPPILASFLPYRNQVKLVEKAWINNQSNLVVQIEGTVVKEYPDVQDGSTYQQFMVVLKNNQRLLVSHDIGIGKPVTIDVGKSIRVKGEYDWSREGGVIHWTHRDPAGKREGGWIESNGIRYD